MKKFKSLLFPTFCFLYSVFFFQFPTLAEEKPSVEKEWSELSWEEKESLRKRWTSDKVRQVVLALKEGKTLPKFVEKILLSEEEIQELESFGISLEGAKNYDLRRIPFNKNQDLNKAELPLVYLEGADLNGANLQGANLIRANLKGADLIEAHLEGATLNEANHKEPTYMLHIFTRHTYGWSILEKQRTLDTFSGEIIFIIVTL